MIKTIPEGALKVIKIIPPKEGSGGRYTRICFKDTDGRWYKTDISETCRNRVKWQKVLNRGVGCFVRGWVLFNDKTINADSEIEVIKSPAIENAAIRPRERVAGPKQLSMETLKPRLILPYKLT